MLKTVSTFRKERQEFVKISHINVGVALVKVLDAINLRIDDQLKSETLKNVELKDDDKFSIKKVVGFNKDVKGTKMRANLQTIQGAGTFVKEVARRETTESLRKHEEVIFGDEEETFTFAEFLNMMLFGVSGRELLKAELNNAGIEFTESSDNFLIEITQFLD